ncbi:MAG: hypothetical protein WBH99_00315, partial [Azovibrio sp.]|uniref:hypothetical protein n=1 Tax=Azovibrio sp. TaxID=1872673 RepID=UPI003C760855
MSCRHQSCRHQQAGPQARPGKVRARNPGFPNRFGSGGESDKILALQRERDRLSRFFADATMTAQI